MTRAVPQALTSKINSTSIRTMQDLRASLEALLFTPDLGYVNAWLIHDRQDWIKLFKRVKADLGLTGWPPEPGTRWDVLGMPVVIHPASVTKGCLLAARICKDEIHG